MTTTCPLLLELVEELLLLGTITFFFFPLRQPRRFSVSTFNFFNILFAFGNGQTERREEESRGTDGWIYKGLRGAKSVWIDWSMGSETEYTLLTRGNPDQ